jgi:hypothetical protein
MTIGIFAQAIMLISGTLANKVTGTADGSQAMYKTKEVATYMLGHSQSERHPLKIYWTQIRFVNFVRTYLTTKVNILCPLSLAALCVIKHKATNTPEILK